METRPPLLSALYVAERAVTSLLSYRQHSINRQPVFIVIVIIPLQKHLLLLLFVNG